MSYQVDSRNENVKLDYNQLNIASPTTFSKSVDFSQTTSAVTGFTWPRGVEVEFQSVNYVAPAVVDPWVAPTYTTAQPGGDTFSMNQVLPALTTADYITVNSTLGTVTVNTRGYYHVSFRVEASVGLALGADTIIGLFYQQPPGLPHPLAYASMSNTANLGAPNEQKIICCSGIQWLEAGGWFFGTYGSGTSSPNTLSFLQVIKLR